MSNTAPESDLVDVVIAQTDPAERLRLIARTETAAEETTARLRPLKVAAIRQLRRRDPRPTWQEIGELLGCSAQYAERLSRQ